MQKTKHKKFIVILLVISILSLNIISAFAISSNQLDINTEKTNFNFISINDLNHIEYTYEEGVDNYKVIESINATLTEVDTNIFKKIDGEYVLISDYKTKIKNDNNIVEITTIKDDKIKIDKIEKNDILAPLENTNLDNDALFTPMTTSVEVGLTNWIYWGKINGSSNIYSYTLAVVITIIAGIATSALRNSEGAGIVIAGVSTLASLIVSDHIAKVYYTKNLYKIYETFDGVPAYVPAVGERVEAYYYANSSRTEYLGYTIDEYMGYGY